MTEQQSTCPPSLASYDWSRSPLGAPAQWPHGLRLAVEIMLNCPLAMALEWGPEKILLFNNAYAALTGLRAESVPGGLVPSMQPPAFGWNPQALAAARDGAALAYPAQPLPLWREGHATSQWLDLHYTPVRDDGGAVRGVLCALRQATEPASPPQQSAGGPERILVVEDNADAQYLVCEMLRALGYRVEAASDGEAALGWLARQPFDILFSDVSLPGMSGVELARSAHRQYPQLRVIFASGYSDSLLNNLDFPAKAMQKPYDLEQLQRALGQAG